MTYEQAISWIDSRQWSGTGKGIVRSTRLLELLGNPHRGLKFIHVAGTNGKGSVSACLEAKHEFSRRKSTGRFPGSDP